MILVNDEHSFSEKAVSRDWNFEKKNLKKKSVPFSNFFSF